MTLFGTLFKNDNKLNNRKAQMLYYFGLPSKKKRKVKMKKK